MSIARASISNLHNFKFIFHKRSCIGVARSLIRFEEEWCLMLRFGVLGGTLLCLD